MNDSYFGKRRETSSGQRTYQKYAIIWRALLGACVIYKNVELAEEATVNLLEVEPHVDGTLFSDIYSQVMKWDKVLKVRRMMKITNMKDPGICSIEVDNALPLFVASDT